MDTKNDTAAARAAPWKIFYGWWGVVQAEPHQLPNGLQVSGLRIRGFPQYFLQERRMAERGEIIRGLQWQIRSQACQWEFLRMS